MVQPPLGPGIVQVALIDMSRSFIEAIGDNDKAKEVLQEHYNTWVSAYAFCKDSQS